jgi:hypothetical protein
MVEAGGKGIRAADKAVEGDGTSEEKAIRLVVQLRGLNDEVEGGRRCIEEEQATEAGCSVDDVVEGRAEEFVSTGEIHSEDHVAEVGKGDGVARAGEDEVVDGVGVGG